MFEEEYNKLIKKSNDFIRNDKTDIILNEFLKSSEEIILSKNMLSYKMLNMHPHNIQRLSLYDLNIIDIEDDIFDNLINLKNLFLELNLLIIMNNKIKINNTIETMNITINNYSELEDNDLSMLINNFNNLCELHIICNYVPRNNIKIHKLPCGILKGLLQIKKINIEHNIKELPEDIFYDNINLLEIDIPSNDIKELPTEMFSNNTNLLILDISGNIIEELPNTIFKYNTNLMKINMRFNEISRIDHNIFKYNVNLRELFLDNNFIIHLDSNIFKNNVNLRKLDLSRNKLTKLDDNIFIPLSKSLKELWLSYNDLEKIPKCIYYLKNIEKLYIRNNNITCLDSSVSFKNNLMLRVLNIESNEITEIAPTVFNDLVNLEYIYIGNNRLSKISNTINSCKKLYFLGLSNNNITILPPVLKYVYWLNISYNPLKIIDNVIFKNLKKIDLRYTDIKKLSFYNKYRLINIEEICINTIKRTTNIETNMINNDSSNDKYNSTIEYIDSLLRDYIIEYEYDDYSYMYKY